jgi:hypothetical protein
MVEILVEGKKEGASTWFREITIHIYAKGQDAAGQQKTGLNQVLAPGAASTSWRINRPTAQQGLQYGYNIK